LARKLYIPCLNLCKEGTSSLGGKSIGVSCSFIPKREKNYQTKAGERRRGRKGRESTREGVALHCEWGAGASRQKLSRKGGEKKSSRIHCGGKQLVDIESEEERVSLTTRKPGRDCPRGQYNPKLGTAEVIVAQPMAIVRIKGRTNLLV